MPGPVSILARAAEVEARGERAALVTIVRAGGSTPREAGAKMLLFAEGRTEGTVGGGRVEAVAIEEAQKTLRDGQPRLLELALTQTLGMCCGGTVTIFIELIGRSARLLIFGAGHVGQALTRVASFAGFEVHVADERSDLLTRDRLPDAAQLWSELDDPALPLGSDTFVMVTTHDHALDQRIVERVIALPHRWLGIIGSRRKAELTRQRLEHKGIDARRKNTLRCPVGLAIGAETPEEIAISILGELIAIRRGVRLEGEDTPAAQPDEGNGHPHDRASTLEPLTPKLETKQ